MRSPQSQGQYYHAASYQSTRYGSSSGQYREADNFPIGRSYGSNGYGAGQNSNYASRVARMYGLSEGASKGEGGKGGGGRGWGQTSPGGVRKGDRKPYGYGRRL